MKNKKLSKQSNVVKLELDDDYIKNGKNYTKVYSIDFDNIALLKKIISIVDSTDLYKLIINYNQKICYLFQTTNKLNNFFDIGLNEMKAEEILRLYKNFYTEEKLNYDKKITDNKKKLRKEIAPYKFNLNLSYIETDRGFCILDVIENIRQGNKSLNEILNESKNDIWLSIDFNKIDQNNMINTISKMENNNFENVKMSKFLEKHIYYYKEMLKNEEIIQCEMKLLHYNSNLDELEEENQKILNKLMFQGEGKINTFKVYEKPNLLNVFNSSIYPYKTLLITQTLSKDTFLEMIGVG
ncbi:hypothetical protein [Clostridium butyricum]|uniref:hypothetical protein n=1 Tax=Clostridium butyricum TaxID=1492 RepID=UPI0022E4B4DD|nr:hypothetical protein [Clostridium butyricum]MDU3597534.1 hypothetical protein [Clostridium butyricum]